MLTWAIAWMTVRGVTTNGLLFLFAMAGDVAIAAMISGAFR